MKIWFKNFCLSFFSDKIAAECVKRGFVSIALALLLSFAFFLCAYYGASVAPFSVRYDGAEAYREFVSEAFADVSVEIKDLKASSEKIINSYTADGGYSKNGYDLIVDTRPSDTLVRFTQVAVKDGKELSYGEWRALGSKDRESFKLELRCTDIPLEITDGDIAVYEAFLGADEAAKEAYGALDKSAEDYGLQLYYLYVKHYYTAVSSVLRGAKAPVLRDYYYRNYIRGGKARYLYVFDNMIAGSFETDGGVPVVFGGYFTKCRDGKIDDIHSFIKDVYYDTAGRTFTSYFVSTVSLLPALIFIPLITALIAWGAGKAVKGGWEKTYGGCFKIVSSFVWVSALITACITFACGWFASPTLLYRLMPVIFGGVTVIRTAVYCITSAVKNKKSTADCGENKINDIFGGDI